MVLISDERTTYWVANKVDSDTYYLKSVSAIEPEHDRNYGPYPISYKWEKEDGLYWKAVVNNKLSRRLNPTWIESDDGKLLYWSEDS